jgi:hypothetical protein
MQPHHCDRNAQPRPRHAGASHAAYGAASTSSSGAMSLMMAAADRNKGTARTAPVPSPSLKPKCSTGGPHPSACISLLPPQCPAYSALVRQEQDTPLLCLSTHFDRAHHLMLSQWIQTGLLLSAKVGKLSESRSFSWASKAVPSTAGQLVTSKEGVLWGTLGFPSC